MATTTAKKTVKVVRNIGTLSLTENGKWVGDESIIDDERINPSNLIKLTVDIIQREWEADKKDLTKCTAIQLLNGALAKKYMNEIDFNKKDANGLNITQWVNSEHLKTVVELFMSQMAKKNRLAIESPRLGDEQRKTMVSANTGMIFFIDRLSSLPGYLGEQKEDYIEAGVDDEIDSDR